PGNEPETQSNRAAVSRMVFVKANSTDNPLKASQTNGPEGTRPLVGFKPTKPVQDAEIRIDPTPPLQCAKGTIPELTATAAPPLDPPGLSSVFHGFLVGP